MIEDFDDDTHYCIKCHATIIGLDNYVSHRKSKCGQTVHHPDLSKSPLPSHILPPDESFSLKADDFFSSLELQSSSKKLPPHSTSGKALNRILTRSKASAVIQANDAAKDSIGQSKSGKNAWIGGHQLRELGTGDNHTKLIKAVDNLSRTATDTLRRVEASTNLRGYDDSDEDSDDYYYDDESDSEDDAPPRSHTGGKWKPSGSPVQWNAEGRSWNTPPVNYTGGKWKPKRNSPPPTHTKGKWKPASPTAHNKESFDIPRPTHTGGKWSASKTLTKMEYTESEQRDNSLDIPKPNYTGGKWTPTKNSFSNEQKHDYFDAPKPTYTGGKSVGSKTIARGEYDDSKEKDLRSDNWNYDDYDHPPPSHTKGKWKPTNDELKMTIPSICTAGKWLPKQESKDDVAKNTYSITATEGSPFQKSNGKIQYWCGPCNRRLASKTIYERHLKSDLHLKRTQRDREFDDTTSFDLNTNQTKENNEESVEYWSHAGKDNEDSMKKSTESGTRRIRKRIYVKCEVCRSRVHNQLMGKHLISHYHCRKGDITLPEARRMVLDNIYSIVLQSPYQCATCKFYCNTQEDFLRHWCSDEHNDQVSKFRGTFVCVFCKLETDDNDKMFKHLISEEHHEVISVINRSVPIIIKQIRTLECQTCKKNFLLNVQLRKHCEKENHPYSCTSSNSYQSKHFCEVCNDTFPSKIAYQRHKRKSHNKHVYICSACDVSFETLMNAKLHRRTSEHRCVVQGKRSKLGVTLEKKCQYCQEVLGNIILLKEHLKEKHPEHNHSCPHCGKCFTIPQQLSVHLRSKACSFQHAEINANKCDKCPFSTESMSELLFHKVLHGDPLLVYSENNRTDKKHPNHKYICPICHKFFNKLSLRCHIRLHTKERPYTCLNCNSAFIRKNNWMLHMKRCGQTKSNEVRRTKATPVKDATDRPYLCSTCGASFKKKSILQMHMTRHTGKLCKCPQDGCVFAARTPGELKTHFLTHSDAKPFACSHCEYKGKTKQQLERHTTVHQNIRKYQCPVCQFSSRLASHLKRHMRLHTGAKPFCCPHCKYRCNNLENLRKHVLSTNKHPGKCIYECKFCNGNFQSNFAKEFKVHLVTVHSDMFQTGSEAATYVAGIYEASDDSTFIDNTADLGDKESKYTVYKLECNQDETVISPTPLQNHPTNSSELFTSSVNTSASGSVPVENKGQDELFPLYIVSKDVVCVENQTDTWNMVGSYDVEESGTLVPFDSDDEKLFGEHFQ